MISPLINRTAVYRAAERSGPTIRNFFARIARFVASFGSQAPEALVRSLNAPASGSSFRFQFPTQGSLNEGYLRPAYVKNIHRG